MAIDPNPVDVPSLLERLRGKRVAYIPNPGNAGDSVIAAATYQILEKLGIDYHVPNAHRFNARGWTVLYGGGGNMINPKTFSSRLVKRLATTADELVVLPHTVKNNDALIQSLEQNTTVICRERYTFDYVISFAPRCNVALADDMAFHLNIKDLTSSLKPPALLFPKYFIEKIMRIHAVPMWSNIVRATRSHEITSRMRTLACEDSLNCFRLDGEMTDIPIPSDNIDLSEVLQFGVETPELAKFCTKTLLDFMSHFKKISTNRLHIAISAALLGINVDFYPNNYFKCRGIYEFSMRHRFPHVTWMGER